MKTALFFKLIFVAVVVFLTTVNAEAGRWSPNESWLTVETPRFYIHYPVDAQPFVAEVLLHANRAYDSLSVYFGYRLEPLHLVLITQRDYPQGFYSPWPDRIYLQLSPPQTESFSSYNRNWLEELVTHELAHAFHVKRVRGWTVGLRHIFGDWVLPAGIIPYDKIEGIAVYAETRYTPGGRGRNPNFGMKMTAPLLADRFWSYSQMGYPGRQHLPGDRPYIGGYHWMEFLHSTYGDSAFAKIVDQQVVRPYLGLGAAMRRITGKSTNRLYHDFVSLWRAKAVADQQRRKEEGALPDTLIPLQLPADRLVSKPLFVADNRAVAYVERYDATPAIAYLDIETGIVTPIISTQLTHDRAFDVHPRTGQVVYAQVEDAPKYPGIQKSHLYIADFKNDVSWEIKSALGGQTPLFMADGQQIIFTKNAGPYNELWITDIFADQAYPIARGQKLMFFDPTLWPGRDAIVFSLHQNGQQDLYAAGLEISQLTRLTHDGWAKFNPRLSPDGRWVVFTADDDGAFNLFALNLTAAAQEITAEEDADLPDAKVEFLHKLTNVPTGAFDPTFSPDGRYLYYTVYTADGSELHRIAFTPEAAPRSQRKPRPELEPLEPPTVAAGRGYNGWKHFRPTFWAPVPIMPGGGLTAGAFTMGQDPLQIQRWHALGGFSITDAKMLWDIGYSNDFIFPTFYVRTTANHFARNYDVFDPQGYRQEDYKQRFTSFEGGLDFQEWLRSNVIYSAIGINLGVHSTKQSNLTKNADFSLPEGSTKGILASLRLFRAEQTLRDPVFVGRAFYAEQVFDRSFWSSDFDQTGTHIALVNNQRLRPGSTRIFQTSYSFQRFKSPLLFDNDVRYDADGAEAEPLGSITRHNLSFSLITPLKAIDRGRGNWPLFVDRLNGRLTAGYVRADYDQNHDSDALMYAGGLVTTETTVFYGIKLNITTGLLYDFDEKAFWPVLQFGTGLPSANSRTPWQTLQRDFGITGVPKR